MSISRRVLVGLYLVVAVAVVATVFSLWTGAPDLWPTGYELLTFQVLTLVVFVVGAIGLN